jgi:hypothetical protein
VRGAGGLEDHAGPIAANPGDQRPMAGLVIGKPAVRARGHTVDIESVFRDVDADGILLPLFRASACHSGLSPGYPFRRQGKDEGDAIMPKGGHKGQGFPMAVRNFGHEPCAGRRPSPERRHVRLELVEG